ncbi:MAG: 30S ribosomal protein S1 [Verrucomicrobiota bacterium]|nr:30S ribosomal protein S1 [Verrucomicrobiota bacterium]
MKGMEELLRASVKNFTEGSIITGRILEIRGREVLVDIGYKSEGIIPTDEFDEPTEIKIGDEIEVLLEQLEDNDGMVVLSREKALQKLNWDKITNASTEGGIIMGKVKSVVKGGLMVNVGVEAFLPGSQIDIVPPKNLNDYVGKTFEFKIVKINEERKNIVISRRELIEAERAEKRAKFLESMTVGSKVKGKVKNITDFGVFLDLDGIDGLLHITDMSWGRINHPSEMVKNGDEIEVTILDIDHEKQRVSLGLKQGQSNPWDKVEEKYPVATQVSGKVVSIAPYGAFVELEPGIEGMIHVSELSWTKRVARASDVLTVGQEVKAVVLGMNKEEQKVSLGIRQLESNPWDAIEQKYPSGTQVKGKIRNMTSYGAFVELDSDMDGMIHVSDMSWTRKINHPSELLKKGDDVDAVVLEIDRENQRISLGIKQLSEDPWKHIEQLYKIGDVVAGKVTKIASFGAFVELKDGIDGLVHISQISEDRVEKVKDILKVGDDVSARVIKVDKEDRRIGLSIKAANYSEEQLQKEREALESIKPGDDLASLEHAFDQAEEFRPGENKK